MNRREQQELDKHRTTIKTPESTGVELWVVHIFSPPQRQVDL